MNRDLIIRGATGIVFLIILIGSMMFTKQVFSILFLLFTVVGLKEFIAILHARKNVVDAPMIYLCGLVTYLFVSGFSYFPADHFLLPYILPVVIIFPIYGLINLFFKKSNDPGIHAPVLSAMLLIAVPFGLLNFLMLPNHSYLQPVLVFFIMLWSNDTFAYLVGKFLGKHKLMESVSPKKTWEGFIGGLVFALLAGFLMKDHSTLLTGMNWIIIPLLIGVLGTLGDLYESRLKRWAGVKDSGQLMPGHGGVLDRFDGVLFSVPFVLTVIVWCSL